MDKRFFEVAASIVFVVVAIMLCVAVSYLLGDDKLDILIMATVLLGTVGGFLFGRAISR